MKTHSTSIIMSALLGVCLFFSSCNKEHTNTSVISLAGTWAFQIDSTDQGVQKHWYSQTLQDQVQLPGSMLTNGKGDEVTANTPWTGNMWNSAWQTDSSYAKYRDPKNLKISFWLQPLKYYVGPAWYQKKIDIPSPWKGQAITLFLERCHWETSLWVDSVYIGMQNSLSAPHVYTLPSNLSAGNHTLSLRIDNRVKDINPGTDAHSISDNTQTNWNGVIGKIELQAQPQQHIQDIKVYPDVLKKKIKARIVIAHPANTPIEGSLELSVSSNKEGKVLKVLSVPLNHKDTVDVEYAMGDSPMLWNEFTPNLYTLQVKLTSNKQEEQKTVQFGMRTLSTADQQFVINDRKIVLRGTLECCIFPLTGFPPTDVAGWAHVMSAAKAYGLNHIRFHSWCPPEAAFLAADSLGLYLSVECDSWSNNIGSGTPLDEFVYAESRRIIDAYGNHPSFCFMAYGNEPGGDHHVQWLTDFVKYWKARDSRHLYTTAFGWPNVPENDFQSSPYPRIQLWAQGLNSTINADAPRTNFTWDTIIAKYPQPTLSHEIGQWCVYPNFDEMKKYTGVLKPKNFEIFQERLKDHGLEGLAHQFLMASGKLQVLCYKADIEAALRTKHQGGFDLLDLHDFPGQGTALVGVLDPFWESKGYVSAKEYRAFCNSTVPLASMSKLIYTNDETLCADIEVAHYGPQILHQLTPQWKLTHADGSVVQKGTLALQDSIDFGNKDLGTIQCSLQSIAKPEQLRLSVRVDTFENSWDIWVYPANNPTIPSSKIRITQTYNSDVEHYLNEGGTVLLTLKRHTLVPSRGGHVEIGFSSIFWNTSWAKDQAPQTLGILCDPKHPVFADFPTDYYSNYQWWDAMSHSNAILMDSIAPNLQPLLRVIDDWFTARPLGLLFECKVGKGKLMVSGIDLISNQSKRPEAKQLMYSIEHYMESDQFNPQSEVSSRAIRALTKQ